MAMAVTHQIPPSSSGSTGRSCIPRRLFSATAALEYWMPAFAGMTGSAGMTTEAGMTNERFDGDLK
jgi:hypothetical protein